MTLFIVTLALEADPLQAWVALSAVGRRQDAVAPGVAVATTPAGAEDAGVDEASLSAWALARRAEQRVFARGGAR